MLLLLLSVLVINCMAREQCFGKQVSFKAGVIEIINGYMNKTKKNFSATLNIMVEQWDEFSLVVLNLRKEQETQKGLDRFDEMKKATVINPVKEKSVVKVKKVKKQ